MDSYSCHYACSFTKYSIPYLLFFMVLLLTNNWIWVRLLRRHIKQFIFPRASIPSWSLILSSWFFPVLTECEHALIFVTFSLIKLQLSPLIPTTPCITVEKVSYFLTKTDLHLCSYSIPFDLLMTLAC